LPDVTESKFSEVEELLDRHRLFIQQNSDRLPQFSTSAEAETQVRELQAKLKSLEAQPTPPHARMDVDRRLGDLAHHYDAISEEDRIIAELRLATGESTEREAREYSDAIQEISDAKRRLSLLDKRLDVQRRASKEAQKAVAEVGRAVSDRRKQADRLQSEERQMREREQEFRRDLRVLEHDIAALVEGDEKNLGQLETIAENRAATLEVLKQTLLETRSTARSKAARIEGLIVDIESMLTEIDEAIAGGFVVEPRSLAADSFEEPDQVFDESISEVFKEKPIAHAEDVVSEAIEVLNMELIDPHEVTGKVEAVTGKWIGSPRNG
jgi:chromosome segregation ATPase